jgi:UDP-hydrolysing UDP-N-acetyl-D-glucosamine 2-epimerase
MTANRGGAPLKVCVVTGSRADYGLMRWVMADLKEDPAFTLAIAVTGSHMSRDHGLTYRDIEADGFSIDWKLEVSLDTSRPAALAEALGQMTAGLAAYFEPSRPDIVLFLGDRYELLAAAAACTLMGIPMGHFSGGEVTEGVIDDSIRHAVSKLAHLHFVANEIYADRLRRMGEESWRITVCGEPGIENFRRLVLIDRDSLSRDLGLDLQRPTAVVTFHPPTLGLERLDDQITALIDALQAARSGHGLQYVITGPCADPGGEKIEAALTAFAARSEGVRFQKSLGQTRYLSLLTHAAMMIGNSSSALHEAPMANLPAVNIGDRQKGRLRGENVIDVGETAADILSGIEAALRFDRTTPCGNPYGSGDASAKVLTFLEEVFGSRNRSEILRKKFVDVPVAGNFAGGAA